MRNGSTTFDGDGVEFPDIESARREAIVACGELLREVPAAIWDGDSLRLWMLNRLLKLWVVKAGLDPSDYSVESLRRTKALVFPRLLRIIGARLSAIEPLSQSDRANFKLLPSRDCQAPEPG